MVLKRKGHGFTLIELLVVIAIIAILAAILFPVFARAREAARKITCVSNARELAMAVVMYAGDWNETFPGVHNDDNDGAGHAVNPLQAAICAANPSSGSCHNDQRQWALADITFPYLKNDDIHFCPTIGERVTRGRYEVPSGSGLWYDDKVANTGSYHWICLHILPEPALGGLDETQVCGPMELYQLAFSGQNVIYGVMAYKKISLPDCPSGGPATGVGCFNCNLPASWFSACGQGQGDLVDAGRVPLLACNSFGQHEGYSGTQTDCLFPPPGLRLLLDLLGADHCPDCVQDGVFSSVTECYQKNWTGATVLAYADGHSKYERITMYDLWDIMFGKPIFQ